MSWTWILVLAAGSYLFKLLGVLGGSRLNSPRATLGVSLLPPALFAGVVALQTFERDASLVLDARVVGLFVAIVATWRRVPFIGVIVLAMIATALARLL